MNSFFEKSYKLIYEEWISPHELKDSKVLDLGSGTGWLGKYCKDHGCIEYVGVDINEVLINEAKSNYPDLIFFHQDLEEYVQDCIEKETRFDVTVISRTIHGIQNQVTLLQKLSKITNKIVIETGVPPNFSSHRLLEILKNVSLTEDQQKEITNIKKYIEYEQPFVEYIIDERFVQPVPSIGLLKEVFDKIGFELCLDTYESVKQKYPSEYGYDIRHDEGQIMKKTILKFQKIKDSAKPISWKEWVDAGGI